MHGVGHIVARALEGVVALLAALPVGLYVCDAWRLWRFTWRLDAPDAAGPEAAEEAAENRRLLEQSLARVGKKRTPAEHKALLARLRREAAIPGRSVRKLHALELLLREQDFVFDGPGFRTLQRAWCELALHGEGSARDEARARIVGHGARSIDGDNLALFLALHPAHDHPSLTLAWATAALSRRGERARALDSLKTLSARSDDTGARALHALANDLIARRDRDRALDAVARLREHPRAHVTSDLARELRALWQPSVVWVRPRKDRFWLRLRDTRTVRWTLRPMDFAAVTPEAMLQTPDLARDSGRVGKGGVEGEARVRRVLWGLFAWVHIPAHQGSFRLDLALYPAPHPRWSAVFGDEAMPVGSHTQTLHADDLDAVLSVTEGSAAVWVVDRRTRAPLADAEVIFYTRDAGGPPVAHPTRTDADGLARATYTPCWQVGALLRRAEALGAESRRFLTHGHDISTRPAISTETRNYVWVSQPIYRPGETVEGRVIVRTRTYGAASRAVAYGVCTLEAVDDRGTVLRTVHASLNARGAGSFAFELPREVPLGRYRFRRAGGGVCEGEFQVEAYVVPEFFATLALDGEARWGEPVSLRLNAAYFFGAPVPNARGTLRITSRPWTYREGSVWPPQRRHAPPTTLDPIDFETDAEGIARLTLPWRRPRGWRVDGVDVSLDATVRDGSGKTCDAGCVVSFARATAAVHAAVEDNLRLPGEALALVLVWHREPGDRDAPRELVVRFSRALGFVRMRTIVTVRPGDTRVALPITLGAGAWTMRAALVGQRATRPSETLYVLGPALWSPQLARVVVSREEVEPGAPLRAALVGYGLRSGRSGVMVTNAGASLEVRALRWSGHAAHCDLTAPDGGVRALHLKGWSLDRDGDPIAYIAKVTVRADEPAPDREPLALALAFESAVLPPGSETTLRAAVAGTTANGEIVCSVVDEAMYAIVASPRDPVGYFEAPPPPPEELPALSLNASYARTGRTPTLVRPVRSHAYDEMAFGGMPQANALPDLQSVAFRAAGPMPMPSMAMAAPAPAPASAPMVPQAMAADVDGGLPPPRSAGISLLGGFGGGRASAVLEEVADDPPPVPVRSNFASLAAWHPSKPWTAGLTTMPVTLPDALTTWKARALALSSDQRIGYAEARVTTQKPLSVRLQLPRFLQERDAFTLVALIDSQMVSPQRVRARFDAPALGMDARVTDHDLAPRGQAKASAEAVVQPLAEGVTSVAAEVRCPNGEADAERRELPCVAYGVEQVTTLRGPIEARETLELTLPADRRPERTALTLSVDRGPLDAVAAGLGWLRTYPYGSVEHLCSKVLASLAWARMVASRAAIDPDGPYRTRDLGLADDAVEECLARILSMQGSDGGFGWFQGCSGDVAMTAHAVFGLTLSGRGDPDALRRACVFLSSRLLDVRNPDDADAAAVFALAAAGHGVDARAFEVLLDRWDALALPERARLCWALVALHRDEAEASLRKALAELTPHAKRLLRRAERAPDGDLPWFAPNVTEAVAVLVLALLRAGSAFDGRRELRTLAAFLMVQQHGACWHNTRATGLAVLALMEFDAHTEQRSPGAALRWTINDVDRGGLALEGVAPSGAEVVVGDEALRAGPNVIVLATAETARTALALPRFYSLTLRLFSTEAEIPAVGQGMAVVRRYLLLDAHDEPARALASGERVAVGQRLRVELTVRANKPVRYVRIEDPKLAGCEPVAKTSGREVCEGLCAHVELRATQVAIFLEAVGDEDHTVSYVVEAQLAGRFTAMPARAEASYARGVYGASGSFALTVG